MPAGPIAPIAVVPARAVTAAADDDDGPRARAAGSGREALAESGPKKAAAEKKAEKLADSMIGSRYTTAALKLRTEPAKNAESVKVIDEAEKLKVTETVKRATGRWSSRARLAGSPTTT